MARNWIQFCHYGEFTIAAKSFPTYVDFMRIMKQDLSVPGIVLHDPRPHTFVTTLDDRFLPTPAIDKGPRMDRVGKNLAEGP